jgi:hypothetical protein
MSFTGVRYYLNGLAILSLIELTLKLGLVVRPPKSIA